MDKEILAPFDSVIGQTHAKQRLIRSVESAVNGGPMLQPLLIGEAGNGKTHLANAYCAALEAAGIQGLSVQPDQFRGTDEDEKIMSLLEGKDRFFIYVDEAHLMKENNATVAQQRVVNAFMKVLDKNNHGKITQIHPDKTAGFTPEKGSIIMSTNFPWRLDKSGAFQSRTHKFELDLYNEDELIAILTLMLESQGFKQLKPETLRMIARCGRGTARPMEKIVEEIGLIHSGSGKRQMRINREDVLMALIQTRMFPLGLVNHEVELMIAGNEGDKLRDTMIFSRFPKLEKDTLRKSKGYLMALQLMHDTGRGIITTDKGSRYLDNIQGDGFQLPAQF